MSKFDRYYSRFNPAMPTAQLIPASYNPREIDADSLETLKESVLALGMIKAVIITPTGTLIAGHQRTKTLTAMDLPVCPAITLERVNLTDEIRFNQLHNGCDMDFLSMPVQVPVDPEQTWQWIQPQDIACDNLKVPFANRRSEILRLLTKYGPWGSSVVTSDGIVRVSVLYATACKLLQLPLLVHCVPVAKLPLIEKYFGREYGQFSYRQFAKTTWSQSLCQRYRLREKGADKAIAWHSVLYESLVIPHLTPQMRVLDFGAGQMDYVKNLQKQGFQIRGIEFYRRHKEQLDVEQVQRDITALCQDIAQHGLFDFVVCDSVLNSVDSVESERAVLACLNAFCKPGGQVAFSGRLKEFEDKRNESKTNISKIRNVYFFDKDGFSAMYSKGIWSYQKFHDTDQVQALCQQFYGAVPRLTKKSGCFQVLVSKQLALPPAEVQAALSHEFNLPLPNGKSYGRQDDIWEAYQQALVRTEQKGNLSVLS